MARPTSTNPLGKLTARLPAVKVPEETLDEIELRAREAGMSVTEYLRDLVMVTVHGHDFMMSLYGHRLRVVAKTGSIKG